MTARLLDGKQLDQTLQAEIATVAAEIAQKHGVRPDLVAHLNADPKVHGILVQLPLPPQIKEAAIIPAVDPLKDVDGFGPVSLGLLTAGAPRFLPCTPHGIQQLLVRNGVHLSGANVTI